MKDKLHVNVKKMISKCFLNCGNYKYITESNIKWSRKAFSKWKDKMNYYFTLINNVFSWINKWENNSVCIIFNWTFNKSVYCENYVWQLDYLELLYFKVISVPVKLIYWNYIWMWVFIFCFIFFLNILKHTKSYKKNLITSSFIWTLKHEVKQLWYLVIFTISSNLMSWLYAISCTIE